MLYAKIEMVVSEGSITHSCPADFVFNTATRGEVAAEALEAGDLITIDPTGAFMEVLTVTTMEVE